MLIRVLGVLFFFWGGVWPWFISIYIYVSWEPAETRYIRADTCAGRSILFGGGDVALVHKDLHIRIMGAGSDQVHTS